MRDHFGTSIALVTCLVLCWFECWFLGAFKDGISHGVSRGDLVDSYVEAVAQGKPYLQTATAKLVDLPLERQPATDPSTRILDASYFHGKYYIYYGILPIAAVLAPWKAITGSYLNAETFIGLVLGAGNVLLLIAFLRLYRDQQRRRTTVFSALGLAIAVVCSGSFMLMNVPEIHQVESATGYFLNCAVFLGLVFFLRSERCKFGFLFLAVLAAAMLMGCRPNQAFTVSWVAGLVLFWIFRAAIPSVRRTRLMLSVLVVLAVVGGGLGAYNYIRFGNIFEFGMSYGTGAVSRPEIVGFSASKIPYNLRAYLFGRFQGESYFPFIGGPLNPDADGRPAGHEGLDQVYGIFLLCPALLLISGALYYRRRLATMLLLPGVVSLFYLSGLGFGVYRYTVDFAVFFAIVAGVGCVEFCASHKGAGLILRGSIVLSLAIVSAAGAVCVAASVAAIHSLMDVRRPDDFQTLARPFNWVRYRYEQVIGKEPRATAFEVEFPRRFGAVEPLLVTGWNGLQDFFYIHYADTTVVRFGFESMGRGGFVSELIPVDYAKPHRIELVLGNGFPPPDHPFFKGKPKGEIDALYDTLEIFIDGASVIRKQVKFHPRNGYDYFGRSPFDAAFGRQFSGKMTRLEGMPLRDYLNRPK